MKAFISASKGTGIAVDGTPCKVVEVVKLDLGLCLIRAQADHIDHRDKEFELVFPARVVDDADVDDAGFDFAETAAQLTTSFGVDRSGVENTVGYGRILRALKAAYQAGQAHSGR